MARLDVHTCVRCAILRESVVETTSNRMERLLSGDVAASVATAFGKGTAHLETSNEVNGTPLGSVLKTRILPGLKLLLKDKNGSNFCPDSGQKMDPRPFSIASPSNSHRSRGRPRGPKRLPPISLRALKDHMPYTDIVNLKPRHVRIIGLYLEGFKRTEIATIIQVGVQTVTNVINSEAGAALVSRRLAAKETDMDVLLGPAANVYRDILTDENGDRTLKAKVATDYFRLWARRNIARKVEVSGPGGRPIEISETKEKLLKLAGVRDDLITEAVFTEIEEA